MLLQLSHVKKSYGERDLIKDATFFLEESRKLAIVGNNGCGKSTLLKMIVGELPLDGGEVIISPDATVGYLAQYQDDAYGDTILENVLSAREDLISQENTLRQMEYQMASLSGDELNAHMEKYDRLSDTFERAGGLTFRSEAVGVLKGLGFEEKDFSRSMNELSGGQKTRVSLGRLLVKKPDLLLLDEPINHLDLGSIVWLEGYLASYKKAVIVVAHDRYFLDKVCDRVVDIHKGKVTLYNGNYSDFCNQKALGELTYERAYEKQQKEIAHQQEVIKKLQSYNREKSIKRAESRKKLLDKMEVMDAPDFDISTMRLELNIDYPSGNDVLKFNEVSKSYGEKKIFEKLSFEVHKGDRIAILGDNGTGKTTILKTINGLTEYTSGSIDFGSNVSLGYYDQEQQGLDEEKTVFDEIHDTYPDMTDTEVRNTLAAFLFTKEDCFKRIKELSGGERGRVALAKLTLSKANFLILDEPTNHLDMDSKEILEDALIEFEGTLLYVSHDRYFVNRTASTVLELSNGQLVKYLGNYDDYVAKKEELSEQALSFLASGEAIGERVLSADQGGDTGLSAKEERALLKAKEAEDRRKQRAIAACEEEIEKLESEIAKIDEQYALPENAANSAKLNELTNKRNELSDKLDEVMAKWEELM